MKGKAEQGNRSWLALHWQKWKAFLLATALGSVPGTISFVLFGASIENFDGGLPSFNPWVLAMSAVIFVISLVLSRVIKRREKQTSAQASQT